MREASKKMRRLLVLLSVLVLLPARVGAIPCDPPVSDDAGTSCDESVCPRIESRTGMFLPEPDQCLWATGTKGYNANFKNVIGPKALFTDKTATVTAAQTFNTGTLKVQSATDQNVLFYDGTAVGRDGAYFNWDKTNNRLRLDGGTPGIDIGDGSGNFINGITLRGGSTPHLGLDSSSSTAVWQRTKNDIYEFGSDDDDQVPFAGDAESPFLLHLRGYMASERGCTANDCTGFEGQPYGDARFSGNLGYFPNPNCITAGGAGNGCGFGEVVGLSTGREPGLLFAAGYDNLNAPLLNLLGAYSRYASRDYTGPRLGYLTDATDPFLGSGIMIGADTVGNSLTGPFFSFRWDAPTVPNPDRYSALDVPTLAWADCSTSTRNVCTSSQFLGGYTCSTGSFCKQSGIACTNDAHCGGVSGACISAVGAHRKWWGAFDQSVVNGTTKTGGGCDGTGCISFQKEGCGSGTWNGSSGTGVCNDDGSACTTDADCGGSNKCQNRGYIGGTTYFFTYAFVDNQSGTPLDATTYTDPFSGETNCPECELQRAGRTADSRQASIRRVGGTSDCSTGYCKLVATLPKLCRAGNSATEGKCSIDGAACTASSQAADCAQSTKGHNFCVARQKTCTNDASCGSGGYCDWYPNTAVDEVIFYSTVTGQTDATVTQHDRTRFETGHMPRTCSADADCGGGAGSCSTGESESHRNGQCIKTSLYHTHPASGFASEGAQPWNVNTTTPGFLWFFGKDTVHPTLAVLPNTNPFAFAVLTSDRTAYAWTVDPNGVIGTVQGVTAANGANNDVALQSNVTTLRLTGPTGAFSLSGLTGGVSGRRLDIISAVAQTLTITNDATSTAANRILTNTGADVVCTATENATVSLLYDGTVSRWRIVSTMNCPTT